MGASVPQDCVVNALQQHDCWAAARLQDRGGCRRHLRPPSEQTGTNASAPAGTHAAEPRPVLAQIVDHVATAGAWCSRDCADFLRGLAFTGMRIGETAEVEWRDLDFAAGEMVVHGDAETGTKN